MARPRFDHTAFVHVPKTAGTTLYEILDREYGTDQTYTFTDSAQDSVAALLAMPERERARFRLIRGHMPADTPDALPGAVARFTVLRDPVDRVISYYNYAASLPQHYLHHEIVDAGRTLPDLLRAEIPMMMNDGAVRQLTGTWDDAGFGATTEAMLHDALSALDAMDAVGITEAFDDTIVVLHARLGWTRPLHYTEANVSRGDVLRRSDLSAGDVALIESLNQLDRRLYDHARMRFRQQRRALGPRLVLGRAILALRQRRHRRRISA